MMTRRRVPVHLPEGALSWQSQIVQYQDAVPPEQPGITYYSGTLPDPKMKPVDCLLYWAEVHGRLRIVGILNHYPMDYPPWEQEGNVNIWVRAANQRQGIGTALYDEAVRRWRVNMGQQKFTESGSKFAEYLLFDRPASRLDSPEKG